MTLSHMFAFVLGTLVIAGAMWYSAHLERRRMRLEAEKKLKEAEIMRNQVGSLSARDLVERSNRRWAERIEQLKKESGD